MQFAPKIFTESSPIGPNAVPRFGYAQDEMQAVRREGSTVRFGPAFVGTDDVDLVAGELTEALSHDSVIRLVIDGLDAPTPLAGERARMVRWATEEGRRAGVSVEYRL